MRKLTVYIYSSTRCRYTKTLSRTQTAVSKVPAIVTSRFIPSTPKGCCVSICTATRKFYRWGHSEGNKHAGHVYIYPPIAYTAVPHLYGSLHKHAHHQNTGTSFNDTHARIHNTYTNTHESSPLTPLARLTCHALIQDSQASTEFTMMSYCSRAARALWDAFQNQCPGA